MENRVNVPGQGEAQLGSDWRYQFCNGERTIAFGGKFDCTVGEGKILSF
jgi:hypothetical protein